VSPRGAAGRRLPDAGINKDTRFVPLFPHARFHDEAASVAVAATRQFLQDLATQLAPDQLRILLTGG
jgi:hypothetical protein